MSIGIIKKSADIVLEAKLELDDITSQLAACGEPGVSISVTYLKLDRRQTELSKIVKDELTKINSLSKIMLLELKMSGVK